MSESAPEGTETLQPIGHLRELLGSEDPDLFELIGAFRAFSSEISRAGDSTFVNAESQRVRYKTMPFENIDVPRNNVSLTAVGKVPPQSIVQVILFNRSGDFDDPSLGSGMVVRFAGEDGYISVSSPMLFDNEWPDSSFDFHKELRDFLIPSFNDEELEQHRQKLTEVLKDNDADNETIALAFARAAGIVTDQGEGSYETTEGHTITVRVTKSRDGDKKFDIRPSFIGDRLEEGRVDHIEIEQCFAWGEMWFMDAVVAHGEHPNRITESHDETDDLQLSLDVREDIAAHFSPAITDQE